ncbi:MAG: DEAD/DEAH box helicase [Candidatus Omnitrophica bacterium]|nr:DEAD/DEAH box helicase [Candidatus Omnitrophota bacterium]MCB9719997.1 DEAD/DEAH box helicase [Candidatus Omnitrophota bacterium]
MNQITETFCQLGISPDMLAVLDRLNFHTPTPIQHQAIPVALEGKDIMGIAQTGTGKTMAFGIPAVQRLACGGGQALVLVPTRELATQVHDALGPLLKPFRMKSAVIIGGVKIGGQIKDLKSRPDIIIATPGRLNDHLQQKTVSLEKVRLVILDEADRMFDMGFEPQVRSILKYVTKKEQTMLFSATMPPAILKLAFAHMKLPITIEIAPTGTTTKDVSQELFVVKDTSKTDLLHLLLRQYRGTVLIFTRTKSRASSVTRKIRRIGITAAEIHSNRSMSQRTAALEGFKRGQYRVLVATDIAARGIDVSMIELVVNFDLPDDAENYVHRIGRTGRAGKEGHAITLATPTQTKDIRKIESLINMTLPRSRHPEIEEAAESQPTETPRPVRAPARKVKKPYKGSAVKTAKKRKPAKEATQSGGPLTPEVAFARFRGPRKRRRSTRKRS